MDAELRRVLRLRRRNDDRADTRVDDPQFGEQPDEVTVVGWGTLQLVEHFHAGFGHYFVTHLVDEIAKLDNGTFAGWARTGYLINAWRTAGAGSSPVCRFFSEKFAPKSSHFYTSFPSECEVVKADANWSFEGEVFHVALPDAQGSCAVGTQRVYRLYNNGQSGAPNHRFTTVRRCASS